MSQQVVFPRAEKELKTVALRVSVAQALAHLVAVPKLQESARELLAVALKQEVLVPQAVLQKLEEPTRGQTEEVQVLLLREAQ